MNRMNSKEETPLYLAAKNGNLDVVKFLAKRHANMNLPSKVWIFVLKFILYKRGKEKRTPLEIAIRWKQERIIEFLLKSHPYTPKKIKKYMKQTQNPGIKNLPTL